MTRPAMEELLQGYFNLDWFEEHQDPWDVVDSFVHDEPELSVLLPAEIAEVLANSPDEEELRDLVLKEFFCGYSPTANGWTYRAWLTAVADRAQQALRG